MQKFNPLLVLSALTLTAQMNGAHATEFAVANVNALWTAQSRTDPVLGTGTTDKQLTTYQFEYFAGLKYGDVYVDAEVFNGDQVGGSFGGNTNSQNLLVFNPRLSLGKVSGRALAWGPIADVSLIARFENASYADFRSRNYGVSVNFNVPGFAWAESGLLTRNTNFYKDQWLWRTVLLSDALPVAGQKFRFNLLALVNGTDANGTETYLRPEVLWQIDSAGAYQVGLRYETHLYKQGGTSYKRYTPHLMFKFTL